MHPLNLIAAATPSAGNSMLDTLVHVLGTGIIVASLVWSAYCLITYLIKHLSPADIPASMPARDTPRPAAEASSPTAVAPAPATPTPALPAPAVTAPGIPAHIVAVIAAAVAHMADEKYKIISIKPQDSSWEKAGRHAVLTSHRIR